MLPPVPHVIDDLPGVMAVGVQELDVVETYFGVLLNELLGPQE
jgi:hypothetical protein